jgi:hypothetical protein
VPTLYYDPALQVDIDRSRGLLERQDLELRPIPAGAEGRPAIAGARPDVVLLSDRGGDPWSLIEQLRADPATEMLRLVLVASGPLGAEGREALAGARVHVVDRLDEVEALSRAVAYVLNLPTRIAVRTPVVFEVTGRTAANETIQGRMLDISTGGFRLQCNRRFERGERLHCFFALGPASPVIFATARVVHGRAVADGGNEYGLEFAEIRLDDRRRVAEFVLRQGGMQAVLGRD